MDKELLDLIKEVAEVPIAGEAPGVYRDELLDGLIGIARRIIDREKQDPKRRKAEKLARLMSGCSTHHSNYSSFDVNKAADIIQKEL